MTLMKDTIVHKVNVVATIPDSDEYVTTYHDCKNLRKNIVGNS